MKNFGIVRKLATIIIVISIFMIVIMSSGIAFLTHQGLKNPEAIGKFFGRISRGFNDAQK
jgi:hypothetical protein